MPRGNHVYFQGPIIEVDDHRSDEGILFVKLRIKKTVQDKVDEPVIIVDREQHIAEILSAWKQKENTTIYAFVRGHIESYMVNTGFSCEWCGGPIERKIGRTLVRARFIKPFTGGPGSDIPQMNVVHLTGFVSRPPTLTTGKGSRASYKMLLPMYKGANYLTEIVTFHEQAEEDYKSLKSGDLFEVSGHYQVRPMTIRCKCPACQNIHNQPIITTEIWANAVEYMSNFIKDSEDSLVERGGELGES